MKDPLDPFSYAIDPPAPGMLNKGGFELPPISMPNTVPSTGSGGMDPLVTTALIKGGLDVLGGLFGSGRRRREEELNRREREQAMRLAREQFGFQKRQYQDALARQRAQSEFMRPTIEAYRSGTGAFESKAPELTPASLRGYLTGRQEG